MSIKNKINQFILRHASNYVLGRMSQKSTINVYDILRARLSGVVKDKYNISTYQAIVYYSSVSAVAKSVDMISDEFASITPYVYDFLKPEFPAQSFPVEDLLNAPNPDMTRGEFLKAISAYYLMTGNMYLMAIGFSNQPPVELQVIDPSAVEPYKNDRDTYPDYYEYQAGEAREKIVFRRVEDPRWGNRFRYIDDSGGRELLHVKTFNPNENKLKGMSRLDQIYYEVEQHLNASIHNLSTLKKGARISGLLTSEDSLSDDIRPRIREQLNSEYAGSDNAGKIMLLDGAKFDFKEMSSTLKDMDFLNLKKEVTAAIYNAFGIPLPLIDTTTMTYSNYREAKLTLYDNAVLPHTSRMYEELSLFLFSRYKQLDVKRNKLWYDQDEIPALEPRRTESITKKRESGVLTINEIRSLWGYKPIANGDVLYQPMTLIPVGAPAPVSDTSKASTTSRDTFVKILQAERDHQGNRIYMDDEIKEIADKRGL